MGRLIKLTESKLDLIIKKVIKESLLLESRAKSLNKTNLVNTYINYNNLGASGTFDEIFKEEREKGLTPFIEMENSCATKVSLALNSAGQSLTGFRVTNGPFKGKFVNTSARRLKDELLRIWGKPDVKIQTVESIEEVQSKIGPGKTGVYICSPCNFSNPKITGHATIWHSDNNFINGSPIDGSTYPESNGGTIYFWQVGDTIKIT